MGHHCWFVTLTCFWVFLFFSSFLSASGLFLSITHFTGNSRSTTFRISFRIRIRSTTRRVFTVLIFSTNIHPRTFGLFRTFWFFLGTKPNRQILGDDIRGYFNPLK